MFSAEEAVRARTAIELNSGDRGGESPRPRRSASAPHVHHVAGLGVDLLPPSLRARSCGRGSWGCCRAEVPAFQASDRAGLWSRWAALKWRRRTTVQRGMSDQRSGETKGAATRKCPAPGVERRQRGLLKPDRNVRRPLPDVCLPPRGIASALECGPSTGPVGSIIELTAVARPRESRRPAGISPAPTTVPAA
jgi:hypothetical protein